jgi:hypothetical protein
MVLPGLVLGVSIMIFYLTFDVGIYGTFWIILLAYVTRFLPYGLRYSTSSMLQIHKDLEESAGMSGASWLTVFRRVVLPLLKPGLIAGWIYVMIVSIRDLHRHLGAMGKRPVCRVVCIECALHHVSFDSGGHRPNGRQTIWCQRRLSICLLRPSLACRILFLTRN